jgi:thiol:disulfide interchange protein
MAKKKYEKFIPLIAIAGGSEVPKKAKLEGVPTVLFIDKNEKETKIPVIGLKYKDEFLQELK